MALIGAQVYATAKDHVTVEGVMTIGQGKLIDNGTACGIDQDGGGFHELYLLLAYHVPCLLGVGDVDRYEVRCLEQLVKAYVCGVIFLLDLRAYAVTVVVYHLHAAGLGAACKSLAYASHAQDSQGLAAQGIT